VNNVNLVKGLFLIAVSLLFGLGALRFLLGSLERPGPGMFPLMASSLLCGLGLIIALRSFFVERIAIHFNVKNIGIILVSLCGFALLSEYVNMILGIIFMVFVSTFAGMTYSLARNVKISIGLVLVAVAFKELLGVQLPLY
jgi:hypothetical protein